MKNVSRCLKIDISLGKWKYLENSQNILIDMRTCRENFLRQENIRSNQHDCIVLMCSTLMYVVFMHVTSYIFALSP